MGALDCLSFVANKTALECLCISIAKRPNAMSFGVKASNAIRLQRNFGNQATREAGANP